MNFGMGGTPMPQGGPGKGGGGMPQFQGNPGNSMQAMGQAAGQPGAKPMMQFGQRGMGAMPPADQMAMRQAFSNAMGFGAPQAASPTGASLTAGGTGPDATMAQASAPGAAAATPAPTSPDNQQMILDRMMSRFGGGGGMGYGRQGGIASLMGQRNAMMNQMNQMGPMGPQFGGFGGAPNQPFR